MRRVNRAARPSKPGFALLPPFRQACRRAQIFPRFFPFGRTPRRDAMSWLDLPRVPEPEVMDDAGEVQAYSSAAAQEYLGKIDDTFVEHAVRLAGGVAAQKSPVKFTLRLLDIGTGPGQIILKLAPRLSFWQLLGVDRSPNMIRQAIAAATREASRPQPTTAWPFVQFLVADGARLPFADASFDLVLSNSVLHHLAHPAAFLAEIARIVKPTGAVLVRDLRRPSRIAYNLHVRRHGRHYSGLMYKLYCDSVRSAYTEHELSAMLQTAKFPRVRVFTLGRTHLGFERPAG